MKVHIQKEKFKFKWIILYRKVKNTPKENSLLNEKYKLYKKKLATSAILTTKNKSPMFKLDVKRWHN